METKRIYINPCKVEPSFIKFDLKQSFSTLNVLSLDIDNDGLYPRDCADFGVVVGRVTANGNEEHGIGIPNVKISIFLPITEDELQDDDYRLLYNFSSPFDYDRKGKQYNILPPISNTYNPCHTPIGNFPSKSTIANPRVERIFKEKLLYTTSTNESGDYMIPNILLSKFEDLESVTVMMQVDLSDIGNLLSQRPYHMIAQGAALNMFESPTKFKSSNNFGTMMHVQTQVKTLNLRPFWGNSLEEGGCESGINVLNFQLPNRFECYAYYSGSWMGDSNKKISKGCNTRQNTGKAGKFITTTTSIDCLRRVRDEGRETERITLGDARYNEEGIFSVAVPLNLKYVITDQSGNLVLAQKQDGSVGIPTEALYRFRHNFSEVPLQNGRRFADTLSPHSQNRFFFDDRCEDEDFCLMKKDMIYTTTNYIPKYSNGRSTGLNDTLDAIAIKQIEQGSNGDNITHPYNRVYIRNRIGLSSLFTIMCFLVKTFTALLKVVSIFSDLTLNCNGNPYEIEGGLLNGGENRERIDDWRDCILSQLQTLLGISNKVFHNDWVIGNIATFSFKYKAKFRRGILQKLKFCDVDCGDEIDDVDRKNCGGMQSYITDSENWENPTNDQVVKELDKKGIVVYFEGRYYFLAHSINMGTYNLPTNVTITRKDDLLFHNTIVTLGSIKNCNVITGKNYLFDLLPITSYSELENEAALHSLDCINIGNGQSKFSPRSRNKIYEVNQLGVNVLETTDNPVSFISDVTGYEELRKCVIESFKFYGVKFDYSTFTDDYTYTNEDGDIVTEQITLDEMIPDGNSIEAIRTTDQFGISGDNILHDGSTDGHWQYDRITPMYFYSGIGSSFVTLMRQKYFTSCDDE